ncbi:MAG: hypothetical protein WCK70_03405 [Chloroflexales bacterium]|jgi:hypothetical protein
MAQLDQSNDQLFDATAWSIIEARRPIVRAHLERWQMAPDALMIGSALDDQCWLVQLEYAVRRTSSPDFATRSHGRDSWLDEFLLPLARDLDLEQVAATTILHQLYRTGSFDIIDSATSKRQRPPADQVIKSVHDLLQSIPRHVHRESELVIRQLCRDKEIARLVVEAWRRCEQRAAGLARGFVLAYLAHGDVGLLTRSDYAYADELLLLQSHRERIAELSSPAVWAQLHIDTVALARAWKATEPKVWCIRLLSEPANSEYRKRVARTFGTRRRDAVTQVLVEEHGYTGTEAQALVTHTLHGGLSELVAYRSHSDNLSLVIERYEQLQLRRVLDGLYAALAKDDRAYIEALVFHLQAAIRSSGVAFPLLPLLTEHPSSPRRIRVSRRFRFGLAAIMRRRKQKRVRRKPGRRTTPYPKPKKTLQPKPATTLIQAFAERSNLEEDDATARLRELITYGALGLLPRNQRMHCLDPRVRSWLRLIKYGRLDGRVPWPRLMAQLDTYRRALGLPNPISPLLARAVFNAIPRPAFWHGGQGDATVRLRQRGTLTLAGASRLHERWFIISLPVPFPLCDALSRPVGTDSHLTLVIEANGALPLAVWPSVEAPTIREICLALYQAIWHPGAENWPVKGLPEQVVVSEELLIGDRADLDRAADYLLGDVLIQPRSQLVKGKIGTLLKKMTSTGVAEIMKQLRPDERTPSRVMRVLEPWILKTSFLGHSPSPVWNEIARHGVVMPGHDTPAAGWLLPRIGETVEVVQGAIPRLGRRYEGPGLQQHERMFLHSREYPLPVPLPRNVSASKGIFVELPSALGAELHYLRER